MTSNHIEIIDNKNIAIGTKSYIQEAINFHEDVSTKVSSRENKMCTKLIKTLLHYQISRHDIFIPYLQRFYEQIKYHNQTLIIKLPLFVL